VRIGFEPCALNADFQHFIPKFNKISLLYGYPKRRVWGERRPKDKVILQIILVFTLTRPKTFMQGHVSINNLHLHYIYMLYIWLLTLTHTTLVWTSTRP
jgi:hypothetical protein